MMMAVVRPYASLVRRDLLLACRTRAQTLNPLLFFALVISLFPLAAGPERAQLAAMAPAVIWVAALLSALLSLEGMLRADFEDGSLEQLLLSPHSTSGLVLSKALAHWLASGAPVLILSPLAAVLFDLPLSALPALIASLALGGPCLSLVGGIGMALTVGLRGGMLLALLVLPLYVPVLIFGAGAVDAAAKALPYAGQLAALGALLILSLLLAPLATAAALRISVS
jgi:heme exporter protein B